uniref:Uncharacterized protein n=1 Tax=Panagrellus redivivus TaxID=6233 RepID=A0A7E4ULH0_PANRE
MKFWEIALATYQYHWLYLFVYADIIIHPIILINRLTAMYETHTKFRITLKKFRFGDNVSEIVLRLHHRFYPKANHNNGLQRAQYRQNDNLQQANPYTDSEDTIRHRATRRPTDSELQDMLKILEMQKNAPHLI